MKRTDRIILAVCATLTFFMLLLPLSVALPFVAPDESGLGASRASGTVWSGTLHDAQVSGVSLGDAHVGLLPLPLLVGETRLYVVAATLRGTLIATNVGYGIAHGTGPLDVAVRVKPMPLGQIVLDDASAQFRNNRCSSAGGRVHATVIGDEGGLMLPAGMTGTLRCDGSALLLPLVGQSGMERLDLRLTGDGKWRAELRIRSTDPVVAEKLVAAGFASGADGFVIRLSGAL